MNKAREYIKKICNGKTFRAYHFKAADLYGLMNEFLEYENKRVNINKDKKK